MNSRLTMVSAAVLLLGAVLAGYWGVVLSRTPQASESKAGAEELNSTTTLIDPSDKLRTTVVVAARPLKPFVPVTAEDLRVEHLHIVPPGSFSKPEEVVGRSAWMEVPAGSWLSQASFEAGGPLAKMIRADERAVAVAVDEVVGGGGHLRPGDFVDVLLFLRGDTGTGQESAQVAVPALRLLSYGEVLGPDAAGRASQPAKEGEKAERPVPRTAVLAVPEKLVTRLMLASQAGSLRLAVRSADEQLLQRYKAGEIALEPLDESSRSLIPMVQLKNRAPAVRPSGKQVPTVARASGVEVFRGSESSRQTP